MSPKCDYFWGLPYSYQVTVGSDWQFLFFFAWRDIQTDIRVKTTLTGSVTVEKFVRIQFLEQH